MLAMTVCLCRLKSKFMCQCFLENQLKVREKSVKSQGICLELTTGNPDELMMGGGGGQFT